MTDEPWLPGLMQHQELTVDKFLTFAARWHGAVELTGRRVNGSPERSTYQSLLDRAKRLSAALLHAGIRPGDRVATLAMNHIRHVEAWYGIMGIGAICHTVNPRLFKEQIVYILNHAADRILLADASFAPLVASILPECPTIERVIFFADGSAPPSLPGADDFDAFLAAAPDGDPAWGQFDEKMACGLCYTSGTTGSPKGVLYSHRSNYLHTLTTLQHDVMNFSSTDVILPVVPMFHANAWGIIFSAPAVGARLVLPGARLDGESLARLIAEEGVTFAAGVPTVWQSLLQHLAATGKTLPMLRRVLVGGAACPEAVIREFEDVHGVAVVHAWGMTETSPVASVASPTRSVMALDAADRRVQSLKQGRPIFGVDAALKDDDGQLLPHDAKTPGHLVVRGPTIASAYFADEREILDAGGWFDTGDIATIDQHGYIHITDRAKDLIKSGGEWISSIEIENIAMSHPKVACAAVVAKPDERWGERPLLLVELVAGQSATADELLQHLDGKIARWWMPDEVCFVEKIPLGPTGKIDKKRIRAELAGVGN